MDSMTSESLARRVARAEAQLGIFKSPGIDDSPQSKDPESLTTTVARLQDQVARFFHKHPSLHQLPEWIKEFGSKESIEPVNEDQSTKQELLMVQYPMLMECYSLLMEFSAMKIPDFQEDLVEKLDLASVSKSREALAALAAEYDLLVAKNLLVLQKYTDLVEQQTRFWLDMEKRIIQASREIRAMEKSK